MPKFNTIIFDLDGTLIDSKKDIANAVNWTLQELKLPLIDDDTIYEFVGHGVMPLIEQSVAAAGGSIDMPKALSLFKQRYLAHCLDHTILFEGVDKILASTRDIPNFVVTNKSLNFTLSILDGLNISSFFHGVYGGDGPQPKKPDPTVVYDILKITGSSPDKTIIVGDSHVDIETGKNAGIQTCGVYYGFRPRQELADSKAHYFAENPQELLKILS